MVDEFFYFLREKSEVSDRFEDYVLQFDKETDHFVRTLKVVNPLINGFLENESVTSHLRLTHPRKMV